MITTTYRFLSTTNALCHIVTLHYHTGVGQAGQGMVIISEFVSSARVMRGALNVNPWRVQEVCTYVTIVFVFQCGDLLVKCTKRLVNCVLGVLYISYGALHVTY